MNEEVVVHCKFIVDKHPLYWYHSIMDLKHKNFNMKDDLPNNECITCQEELTPIEVELECEECFSCLDKKVIEEYDISKDDTLRDVIWS